MDKRHELDRKLKALLPLKNSDLTSFDKHAINYILQLLQKGTKSTTTLTHHLFNIKDTPNEILQECIGFIDNCIKYKDSLINYQNDILNMKHSKESTPVVSIQIKTTEPKISECYFQQILKKYYKEPDPNLLAGIEKRMNARKKKESLFPKSKTKSKKVKKSKKYSEETEGTEETEGAEGPEDNIEDPEDTEGPEDDTEGPEEPESELGSEETSDLEEPEPISEIEEPELTSDAEESETEESESESSEIEPETEFN